MDLEALSCLVLLKESKASNMISQKFFTSFMFQGAILMKGLKTIIRLLWLNADSTITEIFMRLRQ
ncbi:hypothetical protein EV13_2025 [Prochlorococcus sp. MIT 0702]|nr:hypothetical protein EV13_2025 [Prochlorococcus sp. MIT 0702]KGG28183.1 hypothetical protein EV12_0933 [Prochlorococcus sp. MIT 0701]KGG37233.1 hypothetical protein EV14_0025 [Prochlorococcus sp. MIT 0703]